MADSLFEFRFDAGPHVYYDGQGKELPHITGMLERGGWIDDRWFKEEHSERGRMVHELTADYDLGALDVASCVSLFRPYLLGHIACLNVARPVFEEIEQPWVHARFLYGGRPDRVARVAGARTIWEIKSGREEKAHRIQTGLQAVLLEDKFKLPAEMWVRFCEYIDHRGKFKLRDHSDTVARDLAEARRLIRKYAGGQPWER